MALAIAQSGLKKIKMMGAHMGITITILAMAAVVSVLEIILARSDLFLPTLKRRQNPRNSAEKIPHMAK